MADLEVQPFGLTRAQSAAVIRGSAIDNQPQLMVTDFKKTFSHPKNFYFKVDTDIFNPQCF